MINHNYEELDKNSKFKYKADRLKQAQELGYTYISECVIEEYRKLKSLNKVAVLLELSQAAISYQLKKFGEPRSSRGGYRPGDKRHGHAGNWDTKIRTGKFFHL